MKWEAEKENLEKYIFAENLSYEEIGKKYGCTGANVKQVAKRLGIDIPVRRKINETETFNRGTAKKGICKNCGKEFVLYESTTGVFCSVKCQQEFAYNTFIEQWLDGKIDGTVAGFKPSAYIRRYLLAKYNNSCQICGWNEVNEFTGKVPLQIHHINGNSNDNRIENLQILCPNHHALTENFGSRNKNAPQGRTNYYKKNR